MPTPIGLGMPEGPPPTLAPRRKTRQLMVGDVGVGSDYPVSVQSMTTTKTHDINATLQQIAQLTATGCDIVRVACPKPIDAEALPAIQKKSPIPVSGKATPEALVESAIWEASLFEEHGFGDIAISVKHSDPVLMVEAYRQLAAKTDYPLHLGVTEAGPLMMGTIKSSVAFGALLSQGIGDTIRVSLSADPVEEIKVGEQILQAMNLKERKLEIVSCPSCGRAQVDVYKLAEEVTEGLDGLEFPLRVAVMGCVVNGPGEARDADLGVASGNGKGQIFVKGQVVKTVPESQIVETLIEQANIIAEEQGLEAQEGAKADVRVTS